MGKAQKEKELQRGKYKRLSASPSRKYGFLYAPNRRKISQSFLTTAKSLVISPLFKIGFSIAIATAFGI